ncbi:MAG TPA: serine hydrolase [Candidatus Pristimantibacillus sp.]|nr:serine hydrolase [Candidatus Pristimantibacillus sp.]
MPVRRPQRPDSAPRRRSRKTVLNVKTVAMAAVLAAVLIFWLHGRTAHTDTANSAGSSKSATNSLPLGAKNPAVQSEPNAQPAISSAELKNLLDSIVKAKGDYAIAVVAPGGPAANANGDKAFEAASTYKLFIAYAIFQQINSGAMSWSDQIFGGNDAKACFELMIVHSNNDCTYAFGDRIGWQAVDDMMDRIGLHNTQVKYFDNITTANDLALYLTKLQNGTLLNASDTQQLLGYMKRQQYRDGIPAGTGVPVADKVGFLNGLFHDAGIVYGPKGTYVLVIMSNNSSWSQLADAAKQVHNFLSK